MAGKKLRPGAPCLAKGSGGAGVARGERRRKCLQTGCRCLATHDCRCRPTGLDKGQGGKLLFTPPGYQGMNPHGYVHVASPNFRIAFAFRLVPAPGRSAAKSGRPNSDRPINEISASKRQSGEEAADQEQT
jgi:hypothetical protein